MIKLFESTATVYDTLGLGNLSDCVSCEVTEERNGEFELRMEYPITGIHYSEIQTRRLIVCKSNPFSTVEQAFRIYYISKPLNGIVEICAEHISYDLTGYIVAPTKATGIGAAFAQIKGNAYPTCPFDFGTDKDTVTQEFKVTVPTSLRSLLAGTEGSILDIFGTGDYEFNNRSVYLHKNRGSNRGVSIRYGKNLLDINQEENCSNVYTAVYPYWIGTVYEGETEKEVTVFLDEKVVPVPGEFDYTRVLALDAGEYFTETVPTKEQLKEVAERFIKNNNIGIPKVSLRVSMAQLAHAEEFEQLKLMEAVRLCDTVTVVFPALGVDTTAQCIRTVYNAITDKYTELEFGEPRTSLSSTIADQSSEISSIPETIPTPSFIQMEAERASRLLTGGLGGYVLLHSSAGQKTPDEILILGQESRGDINQALNVWRFNSAGLGFSANGYKGTYKNVALTVDPSDGLKGTLLVDKVAASAIQGGIIKAALTIIAPTIQNSEVDPTFKVDSTGIIRGAQLKASIIGAKSYTDEDDYETATALHLKSPSGVKLDFGAGSQWDYACNLRCTDYWSDQGFGVVAPNAVDGMYIHQTNVRMYHGGLGASVDAVFNTGSDRRIKKHISNIKHKKVRTLFSKLSPKQFKYIKSYNDDDYHFGLVAQEAIEVFNEVGLDYKSIVKQDDAGFYSIDYTSFTGLLIDAIKDLYEQIDELKKNQNGGK